MMYVEQILESISLRAESPMILGVDKKGALDLINNYSVGGWNNMSHWDKAVYYLKELKEQGVMLVK